MSVKRRCGRLVPARRRAGLHSCPVCGVRRSNLHRHFREHPDWTLCRMKYYGTGWYATRVIAKFPVSGVPFGLTARQ